tara:strand:+ start:61355 stop:61636 length:282 start_codon:yes stop_codon:yes gene_type:complete
MVINRKTVSHLPDVDNSENVKGLELAELLVMEDTGLEGYEDWKDIRSLTAYVAGIDGFNLVYDHALNDEGELIDYKKIGLNRLAAYSQIKDID